MLNAELNRRGSTRTTITDLPAEPTAPRPDQTRTAPTQPSRRNAIKATLLLVLSISIAILLFTFRWFWLLLVAGCAVWVVLGLLAFIWKAIYDTLQEGDPPLITAPSTPAPIVPGCSTTTSRSSGDPGISNSSRIDTLLMSKDLRRTLGR